MSCGIPGFLVVASCMAALATGCGPATPESMTPQLQRSARSQPGTVSVTAIGANDNNDFWSPLIGKDQFAKAVEAAVAKCAVLSPVKSGGAGNYRLQANLRAMDISSAPDTKYRIFVSWKLTSPNGAAVLWEADTVGSDKDSLAGAAGDSIRQAMESLEAAIPLRAART
jgi:hypothetical protein